MSRATTGTDPKRTQKKQAERRDASNPRVQFEALVEVGSGATGGFEAESVDVSPEGMRLRTAYLPEMGERLVCRFDGFGGEVVTEGEVIWRNEQGRGGEFGLRFVDLDERAAAVLQDMCLAEVEAHSEGAVEPDAALVGARVKLHIEGLGSPMRARVKDTARGEVLVGSSLEFLRVGRDIELEDVEQGGRRVAMIEHVGVEIDRVNNVPQLVVSLRYDHGHKASEADSGELEAAGQKPSRHLEGRVVEASAKETTPEPTVIDHEEEPRMARRGAKLDMAHGEDSLDGEDLVEDQPPTLATPTHRDPSEAMDAEDRVAAAASKVQETGKKLGGLAKSLGPKLAAASTGAKSLLGSILEGVKQKRGEQGVGKSGKGPKRTTAPAPSGALRSDGRRLVRQTKDASSEESLSDVETLPASATKRKAMGASILGLLGVLGIYAFASQVSHKAPAAEPAVAAQALSSTTAASPSSDAASELVPGGAVATANVPLFGATPLSTTEPVPTPAPEGAAAVVDGAEVPPVPPAGVEGATEDGEAADAAKDEPTDGATASSSGATGAGLRKVWGVGEVHDPVSLKLTMDGEVSGFSGSEGDGGFTVVIPGRKSVSSASGLARKDKRIESLNVVNYPDRAEVTLQFKGDVPAFAVKASGSRVSIDIDAGKGKRSDDGEGTSSKKKAKVSSRTGGHDRSEKSDKTEKGEKSVKAEKPEKSKASEKSKKDDSKNAKQASDSPKSEKKSDKKGDKKGDKKAKK
ncbi:MAG: PilZ domain-containing protein [Deltaproteobacteria bacterium]|nr:PilZ domain-containing protein [Deltaproteobacteria bacterium]